MSHDRDVWTRHAKQWSLIGPPLKPTAEDHAFVTKAIDAWRLEAGRGGVNLLVLGMTPELCSLPLEDGSRVIAVDHAPDMIRAVWPGTLRPGDAAVCADWRRMPLTGSLIDVVAGDGSLTLLPYPSGLAALCMELKRVLREDGLCVIRCFAQQEQTESVAQVFSDLRKNRISSIHVLKWRLAMALEAAPGAGVPVARVWQTLVDEWPDLSRLAECYSWPLEEVRTVEVYRDVDTVYWFPTRAQCRDVFGEHGFSLIDTRVPSYELGERCPTLVLERRD